MSDASNIDRRRRLRNRLKRIFRWPSEPMFTNEVDAASVLFGLHSNVHDSSDSRSPSTSDDHVR